jgi:hypothetical protein
VGVDDIGRRKVLEVEGGLYNFATESRVNSPKVVAVLAPLLPVFINHKLLEFVIATKRLEKMLGVYTTNVIVSNKVMPTLWGVLTSFYPAMEETGLGVEFLESGESGKHICYYTMAPFPANMLPNKHTRHSRDQWNGFPPWTVAVLGGSSTFLTWIESMRNIRNSDILKIAVSGGFAIGRCCQRTSIAIGWESQVIEASFYLLGPVHANIEHQITITGISSAESSESIF